MFIGITLASAPIGSFTPPPTVEPSAAEPILVAVIGDSFVQRGMDVTGAPNTVDGGSVDPQLLKWPDVAATTPMGGLQWGFASHLNDASSGKYIVPQTLVRGIGGFNTGQLARNSVDTPTVTPHYLDSLEAEIAAANWTPDVLILQAGTNDGVASFTAAQSYANMVTIAKRFTQQGIPVVVSTVLPRGHQAATGDRLTSDRITWCNDYNALLLANFEADADLGGLAHVVDPRASYYDADPGAAANDVDPALVYDGLHLNWAGSRRLADAYKARLDDLFPGAVSVLPESGGPAFNANPLMAGTGGTVMRYSNAATNPGFDITGTAPDGWTVRPASASETTGITNWNGGSSTGNITGTIVVTSEPAPGGEGNAIAIDVDCSNASLVGGKARNVRALDAFTLATMPSTDALAVGAFFEAVARVDIAPGHHNLIGASVEMRLTEPGGGVRIVRSCGNAPNGTANMQVPGDADLSGMVLRTPPIPRLAGSYGDITLSVLIYVSGNELPGDHAILAQAKVSQAAVRPTTFGG